jgi:hypothetical protein
MRSFSFSAFAGKIKDNLAWIITIIIVKIIIFIIIRN